MTLNSNHIQIYSKHGRCFCSLPISAALVKPATVKGIQKYYSLSPSSFVCSHHLNDYYIKRIVTLLEHESSKPLVYKQFELNMDYTNIVHERIGDSLLEYAVHLLGSIWYAGFIVLFGSAWILVNICVEIHSWDPYPFSILSLTMASLAAIQIPIVLYYLKTIKSTGSQFPSICLSNEIEQRLAQISEIQELQLQVIKLNVPPKP